ncbi:two-component system response regulator [Bacteroidota bacterium]
MDTERKYKIFIVDDEPSITKLLEYKLKSVGFEVRTFNSPESIVNEIIEVKPDLLISDVMMPYIDGIELLKRIRTNPVISDIPVILITSLGHEEAVLRGLEAGATDYMTKPFSTAEVILRVKKALMR